MHNCFDVYVNGKVAIGFVDETIVVALAVNRMYFVSLVYLHRKGENMIGYGRWN